MAKVKFGKCQECPQDSPEKPLVDKYHCQNHYWIFRAEVAEEKKRKRAEMNEFLGIPEPEKKKPKPIPFHSAKRKIENPIYLKQRLQFLAQPENHRCFIDGCGKRADTIEHSAGKLGFYDDWAKDNGITLYLDIRFWKPCCWDHNGELERNPELSHKYQLSKISGKEKIKKKPLSRLETTE